MVCAMNSVSRVACIKAAKVYDDRELKAVNRDEEIFVSKCVSTMVRRGDCVAADDRLDTGNELEGIVVVISV
jgi:post-segregation antitoxin (ccd killing protein)